VDENRILQQNVGANEVSVLKIPPAMANRRRPCPNSTVSTWLRFSFLDYAHGHFLRDPFAPFLLAKFATELQSLEGYISYLLTV
jgi:hypothetical protein